MSTATPLKKIVIRNVPKVITLWPTALMCLCMGLATQFVPAHQDLWGGLFLAVFTFNLVVLTFEFPRTTSLTVAAVIVAIIFAFILLNQQFTIWEPLKNFFGSLTTHASPPFYYLLFTIMVVIAFFIYISCHFDYWELTANELVHRQGLFGDVERFPTNGLKFNSEISDVFERAMVGTGRLIMSLPAVNRPIVLDNVWRIHRISDEADTILEARTVRIESTPSSRSSAAGVPPASDQTSYAATDDE